MMPNKIRINETNYSITLIIFFLIIFKFKLCIWYDSDTLEKNVSSERTLQSRSFNNIFWMPLTIYMSLGDANYLCFGDGEKKEPNPLASQDHTLNAWLL